MDIKDALIKILKRSGGAPFLFVGSGFSRRYIGLESWSDLLARFCGEIKDYGYYLSSANGDLPLTASFIAKDFNEMWWVNSHYEASKKLFGPDATEVSSSLKFEISKYLQEIPLDFGKGTPMANEVSALSQMNVDGIITTNWDLFLEELFPDYKVFVGQDELIFSNPQSIAEIYKIHGCASRPSSLILTKDDYISFQEKNPYLAAKLITIFVEHPVIFLGYSINDPHIQSIIGSIAECLGKEKLKQFEENLIFVDRPDSSDKETFEGATLAIGKTKVRVTLIKTNDFSHVYAAVDATKRKIPARVLRYCKEQMYELVKSTEPETKIATLDIDEIDNREDIEFVVGVGVATKFVERTERVSDIHRAAMTAKGYTGISVDDLFKDLIKEESAYDAMDLLSTSYAAFLKVSNRYIPAFRYLQAAGIKTKEDFQTCKFSAAIRIAKRTTERGFETSIYRTQFDREFKGLSTAEIIAKSTPEKAALMIPFQPENEIDTTVLKKFLADNQEKITDGSYKSYFRKLACLYDVIAFGPE